jgi:hypothetical protein
MDIPMLGKFGTAVVVLTILCEIAVPLILVWGIVELALWAFK